MLVSTLLRPDDRWRTALAIVSFVFVLLAVCCPVLITAMRIFIQAHAHERPFLVAYPVSPWLETVATGTRFRPLRAPRDRLADDDARRPAS